MYYISSVCQWQYTSSILYKKKFVVLVLWMIFIVYLYFNLTNQNFSFQIDNSIGIAVQVLQHYPYLHTSFFPQIFWCDLGHLSFLISYYECFSWSLIVYILPWCCAYISCKTNKLTTCCCCCCLMVWNLIFEFLEHDCSLVCCYGLLVVFFPVIIALLDISWWAASVWCVPFWLGCLIWLSVILCMSSDSTTYNIILLSHF